MAPLADEGTWGARDKKNIAITPYVPALALAAKEAYHKLACVFKIIIQF